MTIFMDEVLERLQSIKDAGIENLNSTMVAQVFRTTAPTVDSLRAKGVGPTFFKEGRKVLYSVETLIDYVKAGGTIPLMRVRRIRKKPAQEQMPLPETGGVSLHAVEEIINALKAISEQLKQIDLTLVSLGNRYAPYTTPDIYAEDEQDRNAVRTTPRAQAGSGRNR